MQLSQCQHMGSKKDRKRIVFSGRNRKDQFFQSRRNYRKAGKEVSSCMSYFQARPPEPRRPVVRQAEERLSSLPDLSGWAVSDWGGRGIWFSFHLFLPPSLPPSETLPLLFLFFNIVVQEIHLGWKGYKEKGEENNVSCAAISKSLGREKGLHKGKSLSCQNSSNVELLLSFCALYSKISIGKRYNT